MTVADTGYDPNDPDNPENQGYTQDGIVNNETGNDQGTTDPNAATNQSEPEGSGDPQYDPDEPVEPDNGSQYVDPNALVEGRVPGIVAGKVGRLAKRNVMFDYHKRGLQNTGNAIIGGELAAWKAATDVAEKDVQPYRDAAKIAQQGDVDLEKYAALHGYDLAKMTKQEKIDLRKMAQEQEYNLDTLAKEHGFDKELMGIEQQNILARMDKEQANTLVQLAKQHGYNLATISVEHMNNLATIAKKHQNTLAQMESKFGFDSKLLTQENKNALALLTTQHGFDMEALNAKLDADWDNLMESLTSQETMQLTQVFGGMMNGLLGDVTTIMRDPGLGGDDKRDSVDELIDYFTNWVGSLGNLTGYPITWAGAVNA